MELYKHQQNFLDKNPRKKLLCWSTGTGKTLTSIFWANTGTSTLFVVPKALKNNWQRNIKAHYTGKIYTLLTKEEFRRDWEKLSKYDNLIIDEAHYFSGQKSQMAKNLRKYLKKNQINRLLLLTATPFLSSPWNIYVLAGHLGFDWSYFSFRDKFFYDRYIGRRIVPMVKNGIEDEIAKLVAEIGDIVRLEDAADVPEQLFVTEFFGKNKVQEEKIKTVVDLNPIVKFTKHHQIENGTLKSDGFDPHWHTEIDKHERIIEKCEAVDKVAVICRYNLQIDILKEKLSKLNKDIFIIRGDVKDRDAIVSQVEASKECVVLINAACSEGYELPSVGLMIFASMSFSYKDFKQICGRVLRINKLKKNVYLHLVTEGGIDQAVYESIMRKQDFDLSIYAQQNERSEISDPF